MSRQKLTILLLLAVVAGSGWWLLNLGEKRGNEHVSQKHDPDYYMENFTRSSMGVNGELRRRLSAKFMLHYPDDDSTELVKPVYEVYNEGQPWHVISEKGWVSSNNEVVLLTGEVTIWREDAAGKREVEVLTRDLRVLPKDDYAETSQATTIRAPRMEYHAIGMRANLNENWLELLSQVHGRHEVNHDES